MKIMVRSLNVLEDKEINEMVDLPVIVPESKLESDFLLSWIRYDLQDDLGNPDKDWENIGLFHKACNHIVHVGMGKFFFAPDGSNEGFTNKDIAFYVHRFRSDSEEDGESFNDFEVIWERGGVAQSLYENSIVEEMMRSVR